MPSGLAPYSRQFTGFPRHATSVAGRIWFELVETPDSWTELGPIGVGRVWFRSRDE